jgi:hypothetical protein
METAAYKGRVLPTLTLAQLLQVSNMKGLLMCSSHQTQATSTVGLEYTFELQKTNQCN